MLAALFGLASFALLRGSRVARIVLAALAVVGGGLALVYVFVGPTSAILPSLVTAALAAAVIWLLYGPRSAREYFAVAAASDAQRKYVSLSHSQLSRRSRVPEGGSPGFERAMSGSNSRSSSSAAASGLRAIIMISELR